MNYSKVNSEEKILNMMQKQGYTLGAGLGKNEQGIKTPLVAQKTGSNSAIIKNSEIGMMDLIDEEVLIKQMATKVLLIENMIDEADVNLQEDVFEECSKYGNV